MPGIDADMKELLHQSLSVFDSKNLCQLKQLRFHPFTVGIAKIEDFKQMQWEGGE